MKDLSNYTKEEFFDICKRLPNDVIKIVFGYFHRDKTYTVTAYAIKNHISLSTLYRYKHRVELEFKKHR